MPEAFQFMPLPDSYVPRTIIGVLLQALGRMFGGNKLKFDPNTGEYKPKSSFGNILSFGQGTDLANALNAYVRHTDALNKAEINKLHAEGEETRATNEALARASLARDFNMTPEMLEDPGNNDLLDMAARQSVKYLIDEKETDRALLSGKIPAMDAITAQNELTATRANQENELYKNSQGAITAEEKRNQLNPNVVIPYGGALKSRIPGTEHTEIIDNSAAPNTARQTGFKDMGEAMSAAMLDEAQPGLIDRARALAQQFEAAQNQNQSQDTVQKNRVSTNTRVNRNPVVSIPRKPIKSLGNYNSTLLQRQAAPIYIDPNTSLLPPQNNFRLYDRR